MWACTRGSPCHAGIVSAPSRRCSICSTRASRAALSLPACARRQVPVVAAQHQVDEAAARPSRAPAAAGRAQPRCRWLPVRGRRRTCPGTPASRCRRSRLVDSPAPVRARLAGFCSSTAHAAAATAMSRGTGCQATCACAVRRHGSCPVCNFLATGVCMVDPSSFVGSPHAPAHGFSRAFCAAAPVSALLQISRRARGPATRPYPRGPPAAASAPCPGGLRGPMHSSGSVAGTSIACSTSALLAENTLAQSPGVAIAAPQPQHEARGRATGALSSAVRQSPGHRGDNDGAGAVGPQFHLAALVDATARTVSCRTTAPRPVARTSSAAAARSARGAR